VALGVPGVLLVALVALETIRRPLGDHQETTRKTIRKPMRSCW